MDFELPQQPNWGYHGRSLLADLVEAIRPGKPVAIPRQDGLKALEVAEAIDPSAASGRSIKI
jgi:predicted dehydrogenase